MPSTIVRPTSLTNSSRSTSSASSIFSSSIVQISTFYSNIATVSIPQLSTYSSFSSISATATSTSSVRSSLSTPITSTIESSTISSDSTSTTSLTTTDSQPLVLTSDPPASTVPPVDPPASTVCNSPPPTGYVDVNPGDVDRHADEFCKTEFSQDCPTNGYAFTYRSSFVYEVVGYNISITPVPFCNGLSTSTCEDPLSNLDYDCSYSLKTAWQNCEWCRNRERLIIIVFRHYQSRHGR